MIRLPTPVQVLFLLLASLFGSIPVLGADQELVTYQIGDVIGVPCLPSAQPTRDSLRLLVFLNETKLTATGTWDTNDLDLLINGNSVTVNLRQPRAIPVILRGNNGMVYYLEIRPGQPAQKLSPTIQILAGEQFSRSKRDPVDAMEVNGGHWEHSTNLVLKLHKHIRGGRRLLSVQGQPRFNAQIMDEERRMVQGEVWTQSDDWQVLEYYRWTLDRVEAHLVGVTYTGRDPSDDFRFLEHRTDRSICLFTYPLPGDPPLWSLKEPTLRIRQGEERLFLYYTETLPEIPGGQ